MVQETASDEQLRYPIGRFQSPEAVDSATRATYIANIGAFPQRISDAIEGLSETQLDTPYRNGGWTVRQVVHHTADSHLNAYARVRLLLTEETPTIKPYNEALWAELADAKREDPQVSLALLTALHQRWVALLNSLSDDHFKRAYRHPEMGDMDLNAVLALYSWHCGHHVAHITRLRKRNGW